MTQSQTFGIDGHAAIWRCPRRRLSGYACWTGSVPTLARSTRLRSTPIRCPPTHESGSHRRTAAACAATCWRTISRRQGCYDEMLDRRWRDSAGRGGHSSHSLGEIDRRHAGRPLGAGPPRHPRKRRHLQRSRRSGGHVAAVGTRRRSRCSCRRPNGIALSAGLAQRATLLNLILADLYGPQRLLAEGLLPPELVFLQSRLSAAVPRLAGAAGPLSVSLCRPPGPRCRRPVAGRRRQDPRPDRRGLRDRKPDRHLADAARRLPRLPGASGWRSSS